MVEGHVRTAAPVFFQHVERPQASCRVVCFHHAGGTAGVYRTWTRQLPRSCSVYPVQLSGRESRFGEPLCTTVQPHVDEVVGALEALPALPLVLFGHSLGARLAWAMTSALEERGHEVQHVIVSGSGGPGSPRRGEPVDTMSDPELIEELRELGGTPQAVLDEPELLELILPVVRADFALSERLHEMELAPVRAPVTALGGEEDPWAPPEDIAAWRGATKGAFAERIFPGGHFFLHEHEAEIVSLVGRLSSTG